MNDYALQYIFNEVRPQERERRQEKLKKWRWEQGTYSPQISEYKFMFPINSSSLADTPNSLAHSMSLHSSKGDLFPWQQLIKLTTSYIKHMQRKRKAQEASP